MSALVDGLFEEHRFDYVYHLAAYAAEGLSHFIRRFNYTNNLIGSVNLVNAAVNSESRTFVFTSSIAVYGAGQLPMTEETHAEPEDPYGIAKFAVELDLEAVPPRCSAWTTSSSGRTTSTASARTSATAIATSSASS